MKKKSVTIIILLIISCITAIIWKLDFRNWQKLDIARITEPVLSTRIYDRNDAEVDSLSGAIHRIYTSIDELPSYVPDAFVAAEDARFYSHNGIDIRRIFGALLQDIRTFSLSQGASTITQQLIKLTHLSGEKTIARKAQEAMLAMQLEKRMSKDEILEAYLNTVYFGGGAYGIGAASEYYFSKAASELSLAEAAMLAGIIKAPSAYAPHIDAEAALERRAYVLSAMLNEGFIDQEQFNKALNSELSIVDTGKSAPDYAWYMDETAREACEKLDITFDELIGGGYLIYTGIDTDIQKAAEAVMANEQHYPESAAQGALIAMTPGSGEICALVGGREYSVQFGMNRATSARRQPGSLIKPISSYAAAAEKYGYMPSTTLYDIKREYPGGYSPGNSGGNYNGMVTMRQALARSLNAATVDLADAIGIKNVLSAASSFGIPVDNTDENLAFALGSMTYGVTPVEMCAAYCALASGGIYEKAHCIRKIYDRNGFIVYEYNARPSHAVSAETAYVITDMLTTAAETGTAKALSHLDIPVAAKTGTAGLENRDTSDAWAAAYTPDIAVTVWFGRDSNADGGMPQSVTGGAYAVPACADMLERIKPELTGDGFAVPAGISRLLIDGYALENEQRQVLAASNTPSEYVISEVFPVNTELPVSDIWETPSQVRDLCIKSRPGEIPVLEFTCANDHTEYIIIRNSRNLSEIAGIITCAAGETAVFEDAAADITQINSYSVIPRHALLYATGITLTGPESSIVKSSPGGILNSLTSLFDDSTATPEVESITDPLF